MIFSTLSEKLVDYLCLRKIIAEQDREFYFYGVHQLMNYLIFLFALFLLGLKMNLLIEVFFTLFIFICVRAFSGGLHFNNALLCLVTSILFFVFYAVGTESHLFLIDPWQPFIFYLLAGILSILPILDHENNRHNIWDFMVVVQNKKRMISLLFMLYFICYSINADKLAFSIIYTLFMNIMLVLANWFVVQRNEAEKHSSNWGQ